MAGYIIKNGMVYAPGCGEFIKKDLYIKGGKISEGPLDNLRNKENGNTDGILRTIDAEGCYVTKGLIDYHVHFFKGGSDNGVNPDSASFPCGITTAVDAGTCGVSMFEIFKQTVMDRTDVRLFAQLLVGSAGQISEKCPERIEADCIEADRIREMFAEFPEELVGLKARLSANIIDRKDARASLEKSVKLADELGCPLTVHITNPAMDLEEMAAALRKGDVMCHIFQNRGKECILDKNGKVREGIRKAKERGVIFDACNGINNFNLSTAAAAMAQGFFPDIISSDINAGSYYEGVMHSLPKILSKYLAMGQPLQKILDAAILAPAKVIGREDLASMDAGAPADLFIFRLEEHKMAYLDHTNGENRVCGTEMIVPQMTIKDGRVVYSQVYFES